jgi:hypothetical protein
MIEYISHQDFPEDQYTKELCYLQLTLGGEKIRIGYVRKMMKNGCLFWSPMSTGLAKNGSKKYYDAVIYDSNFLIKDIMAFLEARSWENAGCRDAQITQYASPETVQNHTQVQLSPNASQMSFLDPCPF